MSSLPLSFSLSLSLSLSLLKEKRRKKAVIKLKFHAGFLSMETSLGTPFRAAVHILEFQILF